MAALRKLRLLAGSVAVLTGGLLYSLWPVFRDAGGPAVEVGEQAPEFGLASDDGRSVHLKDFRGQLVVLNFWATWCPPCVEEMPSLNRFHQRFAGRGVVVLGVSVDEDRQAYQEFLQKTGVKFLNLRDPDRKVSRLYGTFKYPETYLIDRQGRVVQKVIGQTDWTDQRMLDFVSQLLRG